MMQNLAFLFFFSTLYLHSSVWMSPPFHLVAEASVWWA